MSKAYETGDIISINFHQIVNIGTRKISIKYRMDSCISPLCNATTVGD